MAKRNRENMPSDFVAPVPAWASNWEGTAKILTSVVFAVQKSLSDKFVEWVNTSLYHVNSAPEHVEHAQFIDRQGIKNYVYIAYWRDNNYQRWQENNPIAINWWRSADRLTEGVGYWRESYTVPINRIETLHSTNNKHGIANLSGNLEGPVEEHGYPGAARDRIEVSVTENIKGSATSSKKFQSISTDRGRRVLVIPPKNMCVIRSGQDWGHCDRDEREFYLREVHPSLIAGMDYLAENPKESRCLSMRLMESVDEFGNTISQTCGLGYALDIWAFEEWAKSHPTHLKIFAVFIQHAQKFAEKMKLQLWHEVSILSADSGEFEYINCHKKTGLLPYC